MQIVLQMADTVQFLHNLMGVQDVVTHLDLQRTFYPLVHRAMWEAVRSTSISTLSGSDVGDSLLSSVDKNLQAWCQRYGLNFVDLRLMSATHEKFDAMRKKIGEIHLIKAGIAQKAKLDELYSDNELRKIKRKENLNELRVLAANVETDAMEARLAARIERIEVTNLIRETLNEEQFAKVKSREDLRDRMLEIDERKILRRESLDRLLEDYEQKKEDRKGARTHFLATLELQRNQELEELQQEIEHAMELKALDHQIAVAEKTGTKESAEWKRQLEQRRAEADWKDERAARQTAAQLDRMAKVTGAEPRRG